ncbi:hypothetical protein [Sphingorhabdus sp.]|uniref:hypothetical protein n=1 Tax=Sphingorhabdus sp. TaxID=1902408 RepID=UPI003919A189
MSVQTNITALLRALKSLIPATEISIVHQRPWHSLTFSGTQLCLSVQLGNIISIRDSADISARLSGHEFVLPSQIVADIAATQTVADGLPCLIIDALLLDD